MSYDIAGLTAALGTIPTVSDAMRIRNKSRDYYWYSPILREQLDAVRADLVVVPETEADVVTTLAACHARRIPVTTRGAGTGNYGQAMPLAGGVVLDLSQLRGIEFIRKGVARAQCGVRLADLESAARAQAGQELRMHPSTLRTATLGGFVCGGSGGVGSIGWGGLRDRGNVLGARVITMEASPRVLELRGDDVQQVIHAYGTTGVVTTVEIALAEAQDWVEVVIGFDDLADALRFAHLLGCQDAMAKKLLTVLGGPIPARYLKNMAAWLGARPHAVVAMLAPSAMEGLEAMLRRSPGVLAWRSDGPDAPDPRRIPVYECTWNHTTLNALKYDRSITYLQVMFPTLAHMIRAAGLFADTNDEVMHHFEFARFDGGILSYGLPLVAYGSAERLHEIERTFERNGCPVFSPHAVTLEDGGMKEIDPAQLEWKRNVDPLGLLNPGKMRGWEEPGYRAPEDRIHLFTSPGVPGAGPLPR